MSEELLINVCLREVRAALVDNGVLQELFIERAGGRGLVGNIYKGRVMRVLPGLQASFVNVGLERSAFLHASDIVRGLEEESSGQDRRLDIDSLVSEGDELLVQVQKDPMGSKGARLSTFITLPSRLLVFAPSGSGVSVSARIDDDAERERLRNLVEGLVEDDEQGGFIVRTAADGATLESLKADKRLLSDLWATVRDTARNARVAELRAAAVRLSRRIQRTRHRLDGPSR